MSNQTKDAILDASHDMTPVAGTIDVDIPIDVLWECFTHANWWPRWNSCFFWAHNRNLMEGEQLIWCFQPIRWWYLYKMPAIAEIVEVEPQRKVTWAVTALPGFYARHTYHMEDLGNGRTRFGSWEKATGWSFRLTKRFWIAHFVFVKDRSLEGARLLESVYRRHGALNNRTLPTKPWQPEIKSGLLLFPLLMIGMLARWFYGRYLRQDVISLAPGVHAVLNGGGNSLVIQDEAEALLIDTKFPPASKWLQQWIKRHVRVPVTKVVNTHYHYDHTQGNALYPHAEILAYKNVPDLMLDSDNNFNDPQWWKNHPNALPTTTVDRRRGRLSIGGHEVVLNHPGPAHTHNDLWVHLPQENIIATGDLLFKGYYPFLDTSNEGVSISGTIKALRQLATTYPDATFVPGHGPIAQAHDLQVFADYLESLYAQVQNAYNRGLSEDEAAKQIDLSQWKLSMLPSFIHGRLMWATAANNIRWVYRLIHNGVE